MASQDLTPALDAAQNQLGLTFSASDSLDTKALGILGFNLALVIFSLQSETNNSLWLLLPLFILIALSSILTFLVIWPKLYRGALVDLDQHPEYLHMDASTLVFQLLADTTNAIAHNETANRQKSRYCIGAIAGSLVGVGLLIGCIL